MIFDKIKTSITAFPGQCLVSLTYGTERNANVEDKILDSLERAKVKTDPFYRTFQDEETISTALAKDGSMCYRLEGSGYRNAQGEQNDGYSISFYTTTKDLAKAALTQLKQDGFKFNKSVPLLHHEINGIFDKAQARGVA